MDGVLFRIRWILLALVIPVAWIDSNGMSFTIVFWLWLAITAAVNLVTGVILYAIPTPPPRFPMVTFLLDFLLFGVVPQIAVPNPNLITFFSIYPALVSSIRLGPLMGILVAGILALPIEIRSLVAVVSQQSPVSFSAGLPAAALLASTALVGYLSENETEAAVRRAATELEELRKAMAGAQLFYRSADAVSSTTSYGPVLEAMLDAGVKGLPQGKRGEPPPVGVVLFFDDDSENSLRIVARRNLDRGGEDQRVSVKEGVIAETLQSSEPVIFDNAALDPGLAEIHEMSRCKSGLCIPLQAGLEQYGIVIFATPSSRRPSDQHVELMRAFANQAGIAFQNAKLYKSLRAEQDQIMRSENEMRQKLARDLHDGPTQKISALAMQLDYIRRLMDVNPAEAKTELEKARASAQQAVKEIRVSLFSLRPLSLETKGLSAALEQYCQRLEEAEQVPITIDAGQFGCELDLNVAATVFAIIDEAVNNARRHAAGAPINVVVGKQNGSLIAIIQDRGPGFDLYKVVNSYDERTSLGLQNMRERAKLINGDLRIDSEPGNGTRVSLVVPLPQSQENGATP